MRFLLLLVCVFFAIPMKASALKPRAMLLVDFFSYEDESGKRSIENHLEAEFSRYYELKSSEEVEEMKIKVADKIDTDDCESDKKCIKMMGDRLMVDYTLIFELVVLGADGWNIKGERQKRDGFTTPPISEVCQNCTLSKLRQILSEMVISLKPGDNLVRIGKSTLTVRSQPSAEVYVEGNPMGKTPLQILVNSNERIEVSLIAEGYNSSSKIVIVKPGQPGIVDEILARKSGNIRILSIPTGATIFLDGKLQIDSKGEGKKTPIKLRPNYGSHKLVLKNKNYQDFETTIVISKPNHEKERFILVPKPGRLLVTVPSGNRNAKIFANKNFLGSMDGKSTKIFEAPSTIPLKVYAKDGQAVSLTKNIEIGPADSEKVEFYELEAPKGFQAKFGAALALDYLTFQTDTANKTIKTSYNLSGFEINCLLLPSRYRIAISSLSGDGQFTNQTAPFYIVVNSELYPLKKTSVSLLRILVTPEWQPGWIYSLGYEQSTFSYSGSSGTLNSKQNSFSIEGGYESSEFFDFMIDKDLFQETKLRYSTATGVGLSLNLGGIFF